jgi:hypothetical protein
MSAWTLARNVGVLQSKSVIDSLCWPEASALSMVPLANRTGLRESWRSRKDVPCRLVALPAFP